MRRLPMLSLAVVLLTLFVVAVSAAAPAEEIRGKIASVDPSQFGFVLQTSKNEKVTFQMDEDAQVYVNDEEASLADVKVGDRASVVYRQDGDTYLAIELHCRR
jgi:biopolymer transport protein ExbD